MDNTGNAFEQMMARIMASPTDEVTFHLVGGDSVKARGERVDWVPKADLIEVRNSSGKRIEAYVDVRSITNVGTQQTAGYLEF